jgi:hypothetical protein
VVSGERTSRVNLSASNPLPPHRAVKYPATSARHEASNANSVAGVSVGDRSAQRRAAYLTRDGGV